MQQTPQSVLLARTVMALQLQLQVYIAYCSFAASVPATCSTFLAAYETVNLHTTHVRTGTICGVPDAAGHCIHLHCTGLHGHCVGQTIPHTS